MFRTHSLIASAFLAGFAIGAAVAALVPRPWPYSSVAKSITATLTRAMIPQETDPAVKYFGRVRRRPWIKFNEMAPKTKMVEGGVLIQSDPAELERHGDRIVEVPQFREGTTVSDAHGGVMAYVPSGSIKRGTDLGRYDCRSRGIRHVSWEGSARQKPPTYLPDNRTDID